MEGGESAIKKCNKCDRNKPLCDFYSQKRIDKHGEEFTYYRPDCKECTKKASVKWIKENPDKYRVSKKKCEDKPKSRLLTRRRNEKSRKKGNYIRWQRQNTDKLRDYRIKREQHKKHEITSEEWESCKNYFSFRCAYCGLAIEDHFVSYRGETFLGDFHKEHVDDKGSNDLTNCVPSCKSCNSLKSNSEFEEWYNENNIVFSNGRLQKIIKWVNSDHKKYMKM
jgi:hypothetical protein